MRPHLVEWLDGFLPSGVAGVVAPTWFTCVGAAGVVTLFVMLAVARRHRLEAGVIAAMVLWCYVAAVAAGIVVPMALDGMEQMVMHGQVHLRWAGMTSFWGYLAGLGAVAAVCRVHGLSLARMGDLATAPLGGALVFARLGCFVAGCDYGKVTSLPWAVRFPAGSPAWHDHVSAGLVPASRGESLPVHPTELYEAAIGLVIIGVSIVLVRQAWARRGEGRVFVVAAAIYAIGRIAVESCRGDAGRGIYAGLSSGQIFSLCVLVMIGVGVLARRVRVQRARMAGTIAAATMVAMMMVSAPRRVEAQPPVKASQLPAATTQPMAGPAQPTTAPGRSAAVQGPQVPTAAAQPTTAPGRSAAVQGAQVPAAAQAPAPTGGATAEGPVLGPQLPAPEPQPPATTPAQAAPTGPGVVAAAGPADGMARPRGTFIHLGALVGTAVPINRRTDQVATLAGGALSAGITFGPFGAWLDLQSVANRDASHGTILVAGSFMAPVANNLQIGGRLGLGATLVNFKDPVFRDVSGSALRFEGVIDYGVSPAWSLWARPLSFDVLSATALGGPIVTWQVPIGAAYRFAVGGHRPAPTGGGGVAANTPAGRSR